jgi:hypothetical protein
MATINTTCPVCDTPHARKLSIIHGEGRLSVHSTINTVGKTNTIAQVKVTTQGTSHGITQSDASRAAAPPPVPPLRSAAKGTQTLIIGISFVLGSVLPIVMFTAGAGFLVSMGVAVVILVGGCIVGGMQGDAATNEEIAAHKKRHRDAYTALERWENTFACGACAHRFIPAELAQEPKAEAEMQQA